MKAKGCGNTTWHLLGKIRTFIPPSSPVSRALSCWACLWMGGMPFSFTCTSQTWAILRQPTQCTAGVYCFRMTVCITCLDSLPVLGLVDSDIHTSTPPHTAGSSLSQNRRQGHVSRCRSLQGAPCCWTCSSAAPHTARPVMPRTHHQLLYIREGRAESPPAISTADLYFMYRASQAGLRAVSDRTAR